MDNYNIHKCKNCGGELDYSKAADGVLRCEFCMSVYTVPKSQSKAEQYLNLGAHGLDICRFDEAYTAYQKAAEIDKKEPEAYMGMALASSQVQYLKDHVNDRMQPIVHDVTDKSFLQDKNFKKALELATPEQKKEYILKAKEIDSIRAQFYELKKSGLNYDCFICVKVTEDGGRHTEDSHIANTLYHKLQDAGYSPFYSEEEIKNRTGADYEALILYALHSAQSMLLVCTDESYLQTPWVKNEYTRYLNMLNQEEKQRDSLTVIFTDSIVERLPGIGGKIQGIKFNTYDALQRVIDFVDRYAKKVAPELSRKEYATASYKKKSVIKQGVTKRQLEAVGQGEITVSDKAKLAIAADFLKRADFDNVKRFCTNLVAENPSNSEAYWYLFLAENASRDAEEFVASHSNTVGFDNLEKAIASSSESERRKSFYKTLFDKVKKQKDFSAYKEYIELPESSKKSVDALTKVMFDFAVKRADSEIFDVAIKTVDDTERYIEMNLKFAESIDKSAALKYYEDILSADEGHQGALWKVFEGSLNFDYDAIFAYCSDAQNNSAVEDKLFAYGFNQFAADKLFELCCQKVESHTDMCCKLFDFVLTMIPKEQNELYVRYLNEFIDSLFSEDKLSFITRYNDLLLDMDKYDDNAYFNRCLVNHSLSNPLGLVRYVDSLLSDDDYFTAVNSYTEKNPESQDNLYLNLYYALDSIKSLNEFPICVDYLDECVYMDKQDIVDANLADRVYSALLNEANDAYYEILSDYKCTKKEDTYKLHNDITKDERWQYALTFATAAAPKSRQLKDDIGWILELQPQKAKENVAKSIEKKRQATRKRKIKRSNKVAVAFSLLFAIAITVTMILAIVRISPFLEFWVCMYGGQAIWFILGLFFVVPPIVIMALVSLGKNSSCVGKNKVARANIAFSLLIILGCSIVVGLSKAELTTMYVGRGYVLSLSYDNENEGYWVTKSSGKAEIIVIPEQYNDKDVIGVKEYSFSHSGFEHSECNGIYIPKSVKYIERGAFNLNEHPVAILCEINKIPDGWESGWSDLRGGGQVVLNCVAGIERDGVKYYLLNDGSAVVGEQDNKKISGKVVIAEEVEYEGKKYTVTKVGDKAFADCASLTEIEIPDSVNAIGTSAFSGCNLKSILIPKSVKSIEANAFAACQELKTFEFEDESQLETFNPGVFSSVTNLQYAKIPASIISYLPNIRSLEKVTVINGDIADYAFDNCKSLKEVELQKGVTSVSAKAFSYCEAIESVCIQEGAQNIANGVFKDYCKNITKAEIPTTAISLIPSDNLQSVVINGGDSIDGRAFSGYYKLTRIEIPDSVRYMGYEVFKGCDNLTVYCEASSQPAGWSSSWNYYGAPVVWGYNNVTSDARFDYSVHNGKIHLTNYKGAETQVVVPDKIDGLEVASLGGVFAENRDITSVVLPDGLTKIGAYAFDKCINLQSVNVPESVKNIERYAFRSCISLSVYCQAASKPSGWIDDWNDSNRPVIWNCNDYGVTESGLKWGLTKNKAMKITGYCGTDCNVVIPDVINGYNVTAITVNAFRNRKDIGNLTLSKNITDIGSYAFYGCERLNSIVIPQNVTTMGEYVFSSSGVLVIRCKAKARPEGWNYRWCASLPVIWDCDNSNFATDGNKYFLDENGIQYVLDDEGIVSVCRLQSISLSGDIVIASNIVYQEKSYAVTRINYYAFYECSKITSIQIPDCITVIGNEAFKNCSGLKAVHITDLAEWCKINFIDEEANPLYYARNLYLNGELVTQITLPVEVTYLRQNVFIGCESLTEVQISDSVTSIESKAFFGCKNLRRINIPVSVNQIIHSAFAGCGELTSIIIPKNVSYIGYNAFQDCDKLTVYCEAVSKPYNWSNDWNSSDCPVIWGYKIEQ